MAALTADRLTRQRESVGVIPNVIFHPQKGATKIFSGALVVLNAGFAAPGSTAVGLVAAGRAEEQSDNTAGADGTVSVHVRQGVFPFANAGADLVAQANVGTDCFIVDDQTVAATNGGNTRSRAGKVIGILPDGQVLVQIGLGL